MSAPGTAHIRELRALPLAAVAGALGYRRSANDRSKWQSKASILSINGTQFYDHLSLKGGGGAIDLVLHAKGCSFKDAIAFLDACMTTACAEQAKPTRWEAVKHYLCQVRGLDPSLIEKCRQQGLISADQRNNAVFAMRNANGAHIGAEIVGTTAGARFKGLSKGTRKQSGGFWLCDKEHQSVNQCRSILLVESAIDALSVQCLPLPDRPELTVSTAGLAYVLPNWLADSRATRIVCGYDADQPAELAAQSLSRDPRIVRVLPENHKDWNDLLISKRRNRAASRLD